MSSDSLTFASRSFFERAKGKMAFSLLVCSFGLMVVGFASFVGGEASAIHIHLNGKNKPTDDFVKTGLTNLGGGLGT